MHAAHIHCLTVATDEVAQAEAALAGCDEGITKPVNSSKLLSLIHRDLDCPMEWEHGLSKCEAEDLLDWLENQRISGQVRIEANQRFSVRRPAFRPE
jgi:hypothetical protein